MSRDAFWELLLADLRLQAAGTADVSFSSALLEGKQLSAGEEFDIKWTAASLYSGVYFSVWPPAGDLIVVFFIHVLGAADTVRSFPLAPSAKADV